MGVASVVVAANNADGSFEKPLVAAVVFAVFWSAFVLLGIYLWAFGKKYRLEVADGEIKQTGVFTQRAVVIARINNAKWRNWPSGGSIRFETSDLPMTIELGTSNNRDDLIQFLHLAIPTDRQTGWAKFHDNAAKPAKVVLSNKTLAIIFYAFAGSFVIAWIMGLGAVNLFAALINGGFATYLVARKDVNEKLPR